MFREILVKKEYSSSHLTDKAELQMGNCYIKIISDLAVVSK
jgi:hypothetical protein